MWFQKMFRTFATAHVCCAQATTTDRGGSAINEQGGRRDDIDKMTRATANLAKNTAADWNSFCANWDCTMHSRNMHRVDDLKVLYGSETYDKWPFILYSD
jgi:uncharacterized membrane protein